MIDDEDENSNLLVNVSVSNDYPDPPLRHEFGGCCLRKRVEFVGTGTLCVVSASALLVLLPLYFGNATHVADIYPAILFCSAISSIVIFSLICLGAKFRVFSSSFLKKNVIPPIPFWKIVQIGSVCGFGGLCVIYALDRQRVLCHLQDPLKGVILVYSMVYYFCFSRKIMVLQKLFCASTIIIGLFVSVDYALCDEFHCRGYEREKVEDDRGHWSQATHVLWGFIYILGLGIWCFHFSMLEGQIVALKLDNPLICSSQTSLLGTISRTVSHQAEDGVYADEHPLSNNEENPLIGSNQPHLLENISCAVACQTDDMVLSSAQPNIVELPLSNDMLESEVNSRRMCVNRESEDQSYMHLNTCVTQRNIRTRLNISANADRPSALCVALWVHTSSFIIVLLFFLATIIPSIGKGLSWTNVKLWSEILTKIQVGLGCHFQSVAAPNDMFVIPTAHPVSCDSLALYGWMFTASLTLFSVSVYHFLILCQSSVFTVALITSALPLANIFWSLFRLHPLNGGSIQWWPSFTAEFVCTLLGIPIIVCGLVFLCKAHWTNMTQKELCCTLRCHPRPAQT